MVGSRLWFMHCRRRCVSVSDYPLFIHRLSYLSINKIIRQTMVQYSHQTMAPYKYQTMAVQITAIIPTHEMGTGSRLPATTSPPLPGMIPTPPWTGARCRVAIVHLKHCLSSEGRSHILKAHESSKLPLPLLVPWASGAHDAGFYPPVDQGHRGSLVS